MSLAFDPETLDSLSRKELQAIAKKHSIKANSKTVKIIADLLAFAAEFAAPAEDDVEMEVEPLAEIEAEGVVTDADVIEAEVDVEKGEDKEEEEKDETEAEIEIEEEAAPTAAAPTTVEQADEEEVTAATTTTADETADERDVAMASPDINDDESPPTPATYEKQAAPSADAVASSPSCTAPPFSMAPSSSRKKWCDSPKLQQMKQQVDPASDDATAPTAPAAQPLSIPTFSFAASTTATASSTTTSKIVQGTFLQPPKASTTAAKGPSGIPRSKPTVIKSLSAPVPWGGGKNLSLQEEQDAKEARTKKKFGGKSQVSSRLYNPNPTAKSAKKATKASTTARDATYSAPAYGAFKLSKTPKNTMYRATKKENRPKFDLEKSLANGKKAKSEAAVARVPLKMANKPSQDSARKGRVNDFAARAAASAAKHMGRINAAREARMLALDA